ncbi:cytochrome P450 [Lipomyces arxii]|uniref:cytochrome P450 n=1 Tax=Lipomyces arxii TaxID=56418 RepID=UPI0034CF76D9
MRCLTPGCDVQTLFYRLTMDTATEFLFGESVECQGRDDEVGGGCGFAAMFNRAQTIMSRRVLMRTFYWLADGKEYAEANKVVHEFVDGYVDRALESDEKKVHEGRYVFLDALVEDTRDRKMLRDQLLNILLAGRDTTANLLSWAVHLLANDARVYDKLRESVLGAFGEDSVDAITFESLKGLKYLRFVLNEVLRLYPSVPQNFRFAIRDTVLPRGGGKDKTEPVVVSRGMAVFYNVFAMHRRKDLYGDNANEFVPERWEGRSAGWEYLPFNGGPRICLGQQYALTEAGYVLARLVQTFKSVQSHDTGRQVKVRALLTMMKPDGVHVTFHY